MRGGMPDGGGPEGRGPDGGGPGGGQPPGPWGRPVATSEKAAIMDSKPIITCETKLVLEGTGMVLLFVDK